MFEQVGSEDTTPFYKREWFLVLALLLFSPLGLVMTWTVAEWDKKAKIIVTVVLCVIWISYILGNFM